jgi:gamma-glutamyl phosphate reductase
MVRREVEAARAALALLTEGRVDAALGRTAELLDERAEEVLAANTADLGAANERPQQVHEPSFAPSAGVASLSGSSSTP